MATKTRRRALKVILTSCVVGVAAFFAPTLWAHVRADNRIKTVTEVPATPVALVLGAQVLPNGQPSPYLAGRLGKAAELYKAGKVKVILVSGDNGTQQYNEPDNMRRWLIQQGIPAAHVVADYAGFDTYDSCKRAKEIFGISQMTVVSQKFHLPRAVAICRSIGVDAWGVADDQADEQGAHWMWGEFRELLASHKMAWDLLTDRKPVLGNKETSVEEALRNR